jgi:hypothetical protein
MRLQSLAPLRHNRRMALLAPYRPFQPWLKSK